MTELTSLIRRTSTAMRRERGRVKPIVSMMVPPAYVGFRLSGERVAYLLDIEVAYELAARQFARDVERTAQRIAKEQGIRIASARKKAHRQIRDEINGILTEAKETSRKERAKRTAARIADMVDRVYLGKGRKKVRKS